MSSSLPSKESFLVTDLHTVENYEAFAEFDGTMYSGLLPMNNGKREGKIMFWLFEPTIQAVENSMIVWLNGGPGCSSFNCGVLMEISPVTQPQHPAGYCCLNEIPKFQYNNNTWTKSTTVLFVEQPIGTGFSYGTPLPQTEHDVSLDMDAFLQNFYKVFDHLQPYDFFVMGESYAGMFVPSISRHIHFENKKAIESGDEERFIVPLKGAALGNGWIEAKTQGVAVIDYSWWHGLIDKPTRDALHIEWFNCMAALEGKNDQPQPAPFHPFGVIDDCGTMWGVLLASGGVPFDGKGAGGGPNAYDITTWDPNVDQVTFASEEFYNNPQVKEALHAPDDIVWHGCRAGAGRRMLVEDNDESFHMEQQQHHRKLYMDNDRPQSVVKYIADLVDDGIPVIVYNGDRDMTTNMVGTEMALNAMDWHGKHSWRDAERGLWIVGDGQAGHAGWAKEHGNLTFLTVYNSGHMVPYNVPVPAHDLLTRLLKHKSFIDKKLPLVRVEAYDAAAFASSSYAASAMVDIPLIGTPQGGNQLNTAVVALISMMVGFTLALILTRRRRHGGGYERVPNANTADEN